MANAIETTKHKGKSLRSIPLTVSIPNKPPRGEPSKPSLYARLCKHAGNKGLNEQDIIRFALSYYLDKVGA